MANFNNQARSSWALPRRPTSLPNDATRPVWRLHDRQISTLDLNDAQNSKDAARQTHIKELYYYWYYFYQLRSLTLWDFERNTELEATSRRLSRVRLIIDD